ncbi:Acetylcholine receptor subunit alpha-like 2 [Halotydeus destructor]|nr:Acetylcholine receptor subunit alpha-like 2 [Halotydeus destructor]
MSEKTSLRIVLIIFMMLFLCNHRCNGDQDEMPTISRLRDDLLVKQKYDRFARPVKSHLTPTVVKVGLVVTSVLDLDLQTGILTVGTIPIFTWTDEHLVWDSSSYQGLSNLIYDTNEVWLPDFAQWDEVNDGQATGLAASGVMGKNNGQLTWWPTAVYRTHCNLDLSDYPFDRQVCHMYFSTWSTHAAEVNLTLDTQSGVWGPSTKNPEYNIQVTGSQLDHSDMGDDGNLTYTGIRVRISLERRTSLYTYYVVIPYAVATLLAVTMFVLPLNSLTRLAFGGLSLLILVLLMMFVSNIVGTHSIKVPYAVKCIGVNILLIGIALIASQVNARLFGGLSVAPPGVVTGILKIPILSTILCLGAPDKASSESLVADNEEPVKMADNDWSLVAMFLDRLIAFTYMAAMVIYHS